MDLRRRRDSRGRAALIVLLSCVALLVFAPNTFAVGTGGISGTVTEAALPKHGLQNIKVMVYEVGKEALAGSTTTSATGEYTVGGLPKGEYKVEFRPGHEENYVPQFYENAKKLSSAKPVPVEESKVTPGINAELQVGGKISGTVTSAATHKGVANIEVSTFSANSGEEEEFYGYATTNASGEYTIVGLAMGTYKVEFQEVTASPKYLTQFYNDQPTLAGANILAVIPGETTSGINAEMVPLAPPVDTTAPLASGKPAVGHALSCSTGSWTGTPTLSYAYQWLRNGVAIAGANGSIYGVQIADQGEGLSCKVTATNKYGSASATSNTLRVPPAPVIKKPPPPRPPAPVVALLSFRIRVLGNSARVPIACARAACIGTIELTERIVVRHRHYGRVISRRKTVVLGASAYALAAGQSATIFVHLTATGRRVLARVRHHRLLIKVITSVAGGKTARESAVLSEIVRHRHR